MARPSGPQRWRGCDYAYGSRSPADRGHALATGAAYDVTWDSFQIGTSFLNHVSAAFVCAQQVARL